jgi:hypothetical protein
VYRQVITRALLAAVVLTVTVGPRETRGEPAAVPAPGARPASIEPDRRSLSVFQPRLSSALLTAQDRPVEPAHAVPTGSPAGAAESLAITQKWWFWVGVGALLVTTTVLLVVATRDPEAPRTRLGNMEAFR